MSTMSTQLNLGASYLVHDFYGRFIKPEASERERVVAGQVSTGVSLVLGAGLGLTLTDAGQAFNLLLLLGAGTGGLFLLRWFWWRISAATEIAAMVISLVVAAYFTWVHDALAASPAALVPELLAWQKLVWGTTITTFGWLASAWLLPPKNEKFSKRLSSKPGLWRRMARIWLRNQGVVGGPRLGTGLFGCVAVYGALMATGSFLYGHGLRAGMLAAVRVGRCGWRAPSSPQGLT